MKLGGASSPVELAIRYLTPRRRFEQEVRRHLRGKRVSPAEVEETIVRLRELELLDDGQTCRAWIRDRLNFAPKGRRQLRAELKKQGVDPDVAEAALEETVPEGSEASVATDVLRRARRKFERLEPPVARRRMWAALARRGFDPETTREAIARFFEESGPVEGGEEHDAFVE